MDTGTLAEAIRERQVVELRYRGDPNGEARVIHPHALYRTGTSLCLDAVQVAGHTNSGSLPAWRQFRLMEIESVRVLHARFQVAPDFDPSSEKYGSGLIAKV